MSNTDGTSERASRRAVYQHIGSQSLPPPDSLVVNSDGVIFMGFEAFDELAVWAQALGASAFRHRELIDKRLHSYYTFADLLGYHGVLTCYEASDVSAVAS